MVFNSESTVNEQCEATLTAIRRMSTFRESNYNNPYQNQLSDYVTRDELKVPSLMIPGSPPKKTDFGSGNVCYSSSVYLTDKPEEYDIESGDTKCRLSRTVQIVIFVTFILGLLASIATILCVEVFSGDAFPGIFHGSTANHYPEFMAHYDKLSSSTDGPMSGNDVVVNSMVENGLNQSPLPTPDSSAFQGGIAAVVSQSTQHFTSTVAEITTRSTTTQSITVPSVTTPGRFLPIAHLASLPVDGLAHSFMGLLSLLRYPGPLQKFPSAN